MKFRLPKHIFFSGSAAPNTEGKKDNLYTLSDDDFIDTIMELGGTPEELLTHSELLKLFLPILRNDFKIIETYDYEKKPDRIKCNISVLNGRQDLPSIKDLYNWNECIESNCSIYFFEGNHFFINDNVQDIVNIINKTLVTNN